MAAALELDGMMRWLVKKHGKVRGWLATGLLHCWRGLREQAAAAALEMDGHGEVAGDAIMWPRKWGEL